jgi:hypothetical protein
MPSARRSSTKSAQYNPSSGAHSRLRVGQCLHRHGSHSCGTVVNAQLLAAPSADEADEEEAAASGRLRVAGRHDAWEELQLRQTAQLAAQIRSMEAQVAELENEVRNPSSGRAAEDACLLEQLQVRALQQQLQPGPVHTL